MVEVKLVSDSSFDVLEEIDDCIIGLLAWLITLHHLLEISPRDHRCRGL